MAWPINPEDKMIFEPESGIFYQYDAGSKSWNWITPPVITPATPYNDGLMISGDFNKLNGLMVPPPQSTIKGKDCDVNISTANVKLASSDGTLSVKNELPIKDGTAISKIWNVQGDTYGIDFGINLTKLVSELRKHGNLIETQLRGPQGFKGPIGLPGEDKVDAGPKGGAGVNGTNAPFAGELTLETGQYDRVDESNKGIIDIAVEESEEDYKLIATRANIGNPNACPDLVKPKTFTSPYALVIDQNSPQYSRTPRKSSDGTMTCSTCSSSLYYLNIEEIIKSVKTRYAELSDDLKREKEELVASYIRVMTNIFNSQKSALCCAIENCKTRTRNTATRERLEQLRLDASAAGLNISIGTADDMRYTDMNAGKTCATTDANGKAIKPEPVTTGTPCAQCSLTIPLDSRIHNISPQYDWLLEGQDVTSMDIEARSNGGTVTAGEYYAEIVDGCALIDSSRSKYSGQVGIFFIKDDKTHVKFFPNLGAFRDHDKCAEAYKGATITFKCDAGPCRAFIVDPDRLGSNNYGTMTVCIKPLTCMGVDSSGETVIFDSIFAYRNTVDPSNLIGYIKPIHYDVAVDNYVQLVDFYRHSTLAPVDLKRNDNELALAFIDGGGPSTSNTYGLALAMLSGRQQPKVSYPAYRFEDPLNYGDVEILHDDYNQITSLSVENVNLTNMPAGLWYTTIKLDESVIVEGGDPWNQLSEWEFDGISSSNTDNGTLYINIYADPNFEEYNDTKNVFSDWALTGCDSSTTDHGKLYVGTGYSISATPTISNDTFGQTSNWLLGGINLSSSDAGRLRVEVYTDDYGYLTVDVYKFYHLNMVARGQSVMPSPPSTPTVITLSEQNFSGINGTVTIAYQGADYAIQLDYATITTTLYKDEARTISEGSSSRKGNGALTFTGSVSGTATLANFTENIDNVFLYTALFTVDAHSGYPINDGNLVARGYDKNYSTTLALEEMNASGLTGYVRMFYVNDATAWVTIDTHKITMYTDYLKRNPVMSGSISGSGTVSLTEINGSGLVGSLDLNYSVDEDDITIRALSYPGGDAYVSGSIEVIDNARSTQIHGNIIDIEHSSLGGDKYLISHNGERGGYGNVKIGSDIIKIMASTFVDNEPNPWWTSTDHSSVWLLGWDRINRKLKLKRYHKRSEIQSRPWEDIQYNMLGVLDDVYDGCATYYSSSAGESITFAIAGKNNYGSRIYLSRYNGSTGNWSEWSAVGSSSTSLISPWIGHYGYNASPYTMLTYGDYKTGTMYYKSIQNSVCDVDLVLMSSTEELTLANLKPLANAAINYYGGFAVWPGYSPGIAGIDSPPIIAYTTVEQAYDPYSERPVGTLMIASALNFGDEITIEKTYSTLMQPLLVAQGKNGNWLSALLYYINEANKLVCIGVSNYIDKTYCSESPLICYNPKSTVATIAGFNSQYMTSDTDAFNVGDYLFVNNIDDVGNITCDIINAYGSTRLNSPDMLGSCVAAFAGLDRPEDSTWQIEVALDNIFSKGVFTLIGQDNRKLLIDVANEDPGAIPDKVILTKECTPCDMEHGQIAWYITGWQTGACCGGYITDIDGSKWLIIQRSIGTDTSCGGGDSLSNSCVAYHDKAGNGHPAIAWPTVDGWEGIGVPTSGTKEFVVDPTMSARFIGILNGSTYPSPAAVHKTEGNIENVSFVIFPAP